MADAPRDDERRLVDAGEDVAPVDRAINDEEVGDVDGVDAEVS